MVDAMKRVFYAARHREPWRIVTLAVFELMHRRARRLSRSNPQLAVFAFDRVGMVINRDGRFEKWSLEAVRDFLLDRGLWRTDATVLDVGANIGNHAVFFAQDFAAVHAFEPHPKAAMLLRFNAEGRPITVHTVAASDASGQAILKSSAINLGHSSLGTGDANGLEEFEVEMMRIDDLGALRDADIAMMKVDVEGAELSVLKGSVETVSRCRPVILFEQDAADFTNQTSETIEFIRDLDYRFFAIQNRYGLGNSKFLRIASSLVRSVMGYQKMIVEIDRFEHAFYEMIIAVPAER